MASDSSFARAVSEGCAAFVADPNRLDGLVAAQHYRLAYWRVSSDEINYRRFFDINDLAGLRVEDAEVLARTHELVFAMIADGRIQGLRIDHIDGLSNPGGYAQLLVDRSAALRQPLYLVVEKILLGEERLRSSWRIAGTTGYDFMNLVAGIFIDQSSERGFDRIYRRVIGRLTTFADEAYEAKKRVMRIDLASELSVLIDALVRIAHADRRSRDFTSNALRRALIEVFAMFPVYRTYVVSEEIEADDRAVIHTAVEAARSRSEFPDNAIFDFIRDALGAQLETAGASYDRVDVLQFAMRAQQYTGPVTAKSLEDTAFYRYVRLIALNEVGGEPARFGRSLEEFHAANLERSQTHPHAMLATATHDHKRGEDTRLRIAALTEFAPEWSRAVGRWARMNAGFHLDEQTPSPVDEFLFYQTVVGTLPTAWLRDGEVDAAELTAYADRLVAYAQKAAREAKLRTSWTDRHTEYEDALEAFIRATLAADTPFLRDVRAFTALLAPVAAIHSLAQVALKLGSPGMPDIYQGCELWDFSLVDPDNRRPVDYDARRAMLAEFEANAVSLDTLLDAWGDGRIKLFLTWKLLRLRRERVMTFLEGSYRPLETTGSGAASIVAFARDEIVFAVPRLIRNRVRNGLRVAFDNERILTGRPDGVYRNVFDDRIVTADAEGNISGAGAFANAPFAVLVPEER